MQRLDVGQRRRIEALARAKGKSCEGCGSAELRCGEDARLTYNHGFMVDLWCDNDAAHPQGAHQYFTISSDEAQGIGL
jgi:hypothetical protein